MVCEQLRQMTGVDFRPGPGEPEILATFGFRTANLLMEGSVYCCE